ncbi:MAG: DJ-1/PfpI family protein [Clostridia bacterium]|nr:DJ-1/PfpI family protein [Clostridia bacterium]MBQ9997286.1 DJ-1/PfpI family protein [Clostridia bacterium]
MILEFLAPGFEEIEALAPVDILRRAGLEIRTVAITEQGTAVCGSHNIPVTADLTADEALALAETESIDMIILPGGMPGAANLDVSDTVQFFLDKAVAEGAYIASICAAPMIPGKRGLLNGRRATCYPGFEQYLDGADYTGGRVEIDGKFVTACGMGAAVEFGLALTAILKGEQAAETIASAVFAK